MAFHNPESDPIENLIYQFSKLPSIGRKSAQRLTYYLLSQDKGRSEILSRAIMETREKIRPCGLCHNYTQEEKCRICSSPGRRENLICVVEKPSDIVLFEQSGVYQGLYHVLGGCISPLDGIGPNELNVDSLIHRVRDLSEVELIFALNTNADGETTVMYLTRRLKEFKVKIYRLARGIPMGSELQYVDEITMKQSLENRVPI